MKKYVSVLVVLLVLFSVGACKKKEKEQVKQPPQAQGPIMDASAPSPQSPHSGTGPKVQFEVAMPAEVQAGWSAVKLMVEDRELKKTREVTVKIGDELKVPDSNLAIKVLYFLPDFKMNGAVITSVTNSLNNPAAGIVISENGAQIFPETGKIGWLYEKFPTIHPFQHKRFGLALKEGVKK